MIQSPSPDWIIRTFPLRSQCLCGEKSALFYGVLDVRLWCFRENAHPTGCFYYSHWVSSGDRGKNPLDRETSRRYPDQKEEFHFLLSHCYLHSHQYHPDLVLYPVSKIDKIRNIITAWRIPSQEVWLSTDG